MKLKLICFVIIVLLIFVVIIQTNSIFRESYKQAVLQATFRNLAEFNYAFMVENEIDWEEYINQLETSAKEKPLLREGFYIDECKKQQQRNLRAFDQ
jgi:hypothetical protein